MAHVGDELRLVLACYLELSALLGDLLEQAGVLQGDHGLVGEALHQAHDGRQKLAGSAPLQYQSAQRTLAAEQGNNKTRAEARFDRGIAQGIAWSLKDIRHLQRLPPCDGL